eukprot:TRINITY_DN41731_c0_g1_i1.p1 TRINITY_DN41731_c0_g1~~TRINITY_DN41731_c0_g1_i1.p1  ORF type:complete len:568 (+),score=66.52 TRINITY_DN41731_c0_g1_i1:59-1762(+)
MARRKGLRAPLLLWVAPMFSVVLAPLFLHLVTTDLAESTDSHMLAIGALLLFTAITSALGCLLHEFCLFMDSIPAIIFCIQMVFLLACAFVWRPSVFQMAEWRVPGHTHAQPEGVATHDPQLPPKIPKGWFDAGDGFCEDSTTHQEFSSLHALGKTFEECAQDSASDPNSVAFDFSRKNGGCDIRYPAGTLSIELNGYHWWGWGAGARKPAGSKKQKNELETRCYARVDAPAEVLRKALPLTTNLHPQYHALIREYPFQPVRNENRQLVNIILVRSPFRSQLQEQLFEKYKDELLFIGISSFEDFPLPPPNPFSAKFPVDRYVGRFPGFLYMHRHPETIFPSHVKLLLMSQSDFSLPQRAEPVPKIYDFVFSGSDQDVRNDCVGWSSYAKNWTFVKQALEVMCGELGMTGVLVATKDKQNRKACSIPESCHGKVEQTQFLSQEGFFKYVKSSRFLFVPQVHDASPRVTTQALALDVPLLMNRNIIGGWKYLNNRTGELFNDLSDLRESVQRLLRNIKAGVVYEPRRYVDENYNDHNSAPRLKQFVEHHFSDRVKLPQGTRMLFPSGA